VTANDHVPVTANDNAPVTVHEVPLFLTAGIAGGAGLFILLIVIILVIILSVYCKNRRFSRKYSDSLKPIAANNQMFENKVEEG
jgi:uncharacterized membrane protein